MLYRAVICLTSCLPHRPRSGDVCSSWRSHWTSCACVSPPRGTPSHRDLTTPLSSAVCTQQQSRQRPSLLVWNEKYKLQRKTKVSAIYGEQHNQHKHRELTGYYRIYSSWHQHLSCSCGWIMETVFFSSGHLYPPNGRWCWWFYKIVH